MSEAVGEHIEPHTPALKPEDWEDPEPKVTGYFVIWGFILLFATIVALEFLTYAFANAEHDRKGSGTALRAEQGRQTGLDPQTFKREQLRRLRSPQKGGMRIDAAIQKVIQDKS